MSIAIELRCNAERCSWIIPHNVIVAVDALRGIAPQAVECIFGDQHAGLGAERSVSRVKLISVISELMQLAANRSAGYRVRMSGFGSDSRERVGRGAGGLLIGKVYFAIMCVDDYWKIYPVSSVSDQKRSLIPNEMKGLPRRAPAEIATDNLGVVRVEEVTGERSGLIRILVELNDAAAAATDDLVTLVVS